ncbi:MAG: aminodeoxychorismate/anthranilate synthase component II [Saprospiraceae bacterium]|nr:aminodeoxychorismate/anthranilate synthase component II [Saprospiraceae bacterium]MDW8228665.1 aminodeoxychorismate/anthranilate synthase component II [Saprospiraceae bacterium]
MTVLLLDNYDSFTYNLYDYLRQAGVECVVVRNDAPDLLAFSPDDFDAVVLSPGPGRPEAAGWMPELLAAWHQDLPVLGVCLGHQAIGLFYGAQIARAPLPMHGKTSVVQHRGHPIFKDIPRRFSVMRYHSLAIVGWEKTPLRPLAWADDGVLMAIAHRSLPIVGVQFHPESALTEHGLTLIQNWVNWAKEQASRYRKTAHHSLFMPDPA